MENQKTNPIVEAYEQGKRIRRKDWGAGKWIKKHSFKDSIDEKGTKRVDIWSFDIYPENWEILPDAIEPKTPRFIDSIQQAIELLKENGYEIYQITKTKL